MMHMCRFFIQTGEGIKKANITFKTAVYAYENGHKQLAHQYAERAAELNDMFGPLKDELLPDKE